MSNDFIKKIEIKKFKCFHNFKIDGFKRINLISGYNDIGKTTLLEACLLSTSKSIDIIYDRLLSLETTRNVVNMISNNNSDNEDIRNLITQEEFTISSNENLVFYKLSDGEYKIGCLEEEYEQNYSDLHDLIKILFPYPKYNSSSDFLSSNMLSNVLFKALIDKLKTANKYDEFNQYLKDLFNIFNIDIINDVPSIKKTKDGNYMPLSSCGQGLKSFANMLLSLLNHQEYIFIDDIDSGIHYTLYDKLWEIIFEISKKQDIQVFATTHSKECEESYHRVSKKLEEKDISSIELSTNREDEIVAITLNSQE